MYDKLNIIVPSITSVFTVLITIYCERKFNQKKEKERKNNEILLNTNRYLTKYKEYLESMFLEIFIPFAFDFNFIISKENYYEIRDYNKFIDNYYSVGYSSNVLIEFLEDKYKDFMILKKVYSKSSYHDLFNPLLDLTDSLVDEAQKINSSSYYIEELISDDLILTLEDKNELDSLFKNFKKEYYKLIDELNVLINITETNFYLD